MAILPVIRETPVQEVVEIRNRGSYTIPEQARKAHRLLVDIEVISVTRNQYQNFNYNLPQGDYCNVTFWSGASINRTEKVKYPSQRLIDWVNIEASNAFNAGLAAEVVNRTVGALGLALGFPAIRGDRRPPNVWGFMTSHLKFVCPPDTQIRVTCQWYPFPNIEDFEEPDADLDDPAKDEPEYPKPRENPRSDPWKDNDPASPPDQARDPRDFDPANVPPEPPPIPECELHTWKVEFSHSTFSGTAYYSFRGPVTYSRGADGRAVIVTGGSPDGPCPPVQVVSRTAFGGVDEAGTVTLTRID